MLLIKVKTSRDTGEWFNYSQGGERPFSSKMFSKLEKTGIYDEFKEGNVTRRVIKPDFVPVSLFQVKSFMGIKLDQPLPKKPKKIKIGIGLIFGYTGIAVYTQILPITPKKHFVCHYSVNKYGLCLNGRDDQIMRNTYQQVKRLRPFNNWDDICNFLSSDKFKIWIGEFLEELAKNILPLIENVNYGGSKNSPAGLPSVIVLRRIIEKQKRMALQNNTVVKKAYWTRREE